MTNNNQYDAASDDEIQDQLAWAQLHFVFDDIVGEMSLAEFLGDIARRPELWASDRVLEFTRHVVADKLLDIFPTIFTVEAMRETYAKMLTEAELTDMSQNFMRHRLPKILREAD